MTEALMTLEAESKLQAVEVLVDGLSKMEGQLELGYGKLAHMILEVSEKRYWAGKYNSFGEYRDYLSEKFQIGRAQLYKYLSVARELGGDVTQDELSTMGISKAMLLKESKEEKGTLDAASVQAALDPEVTAKKLKQILFENSNPSTNETGVWFDVDFSSYADYEKQQTINDAANAARHQDPPIPESWPEHVQKMEILYRICQEFLAAYSDKIVPGGRGI